MNFNKLRLAANKGGPIHYLGNRYLSLPDLSGHMKVDHSWLIDLFAVLSKNTRGKKYRKCFEPLAGSASWTLAAIELGLAEEYIINDSNDILIRAHILMRDNPDSIKETYANLSNSYTKSVAKKDFFQEIIENYNRADKQQKSLLLPFIINHSWSGMLFHNARGDILYHENKIDGRIIPGYLETASLMLEEFFSEVDRVSNLFNSNKVKFLSGDFLQAVSDLESGDFVVLNPPYPENERSITEKTGIYTELYSPEVLHENIVGLIREMEDKGIEYVMTYGFYNPRMKRFVIYDKNHQLKNFFRIIGYPNCAFGMALDQMYFSPKFLIPDELNSIFIPASDVLKSKELTSEEAVKSFLDFSRQRLLSL